jgi:hypothetical protein
LRGIGTAEGQTAADIAAQHLPEALRDVEPFGLGLAGLRPRHERLDAPADEVDAPLRNKG